MEEDKPVFDFKAHEKGNQTFRINLKIFFFSEIYTIRWSPRGHLIASASFDHSIKIWNTERGECTYRLMKHSEPVYTVAFSPDARIS